MPVSPWHRAAPTGPPSAANGSASGRSVPGSSSHADGPSRRGCAAAGRIGRVVPNRAGRCGRDEPLRAGDTLSRVGPHRRSGGQSRGGGRVLYQFLKYIVLGPPLKLLFRPWVEGMENIPTHGPAILASNHLSFSDSIFLPLMTPRRITFLAKAEYFTERGVKGRMKKYFFAGVGQVPIDRSGGRASEGAIGNGLEVLRRGDVLGIYPE